jgi:hypothetical protein
MRCLRPFSLAAAVVAVGLLAAGCGSTRTVVRAVTVEKGLAQPARSGDQWLYGHIRSLTRSGDHYLLRFDPAWFTSGVTANAAAAAAQHQSCRPEACPPVPNDNYRVDEGHQLLAFILPGTTHGTILTRNGQMTGPFPATRIDAGQLAAIVANGKAPGITLFEPLDSGVWILVHVDTVRAFYQQYVP